MKRALFLVLAFAVLPLAPALAEGCLEDGRLVRPEVDPPLPEANGGVLVRAGGDIECLEIHVRGVPADLPLSVSLHGGDRVIQMGALPAAVEGLRKLVRCNGEGDTLPGEVRRVEQLFEFEIVVANAAEQAVLFGRVPVVECRDEPGGGDDEPEEEPIAETALAFLTPPEGSPSSAAGKLALRRFEGREVFLLDMAGLPEREIGLHLEDDTGAFTQLSAFYVPDFGAARFLRDTGEADDLPLDAASLDDLAGRRIEVHDEMGKTVLEGVVPALTAPPAGPPQDATARTMLVRPEAALLADANGTLTVTRTGGEERLEIQVDRVRPFHDLELVVERATEDGPVRGEDGEGPIFLPVAQLQADGAGSLTFVRDTANGETLPRGGTLASLANTAIQIVDPAAELVVLHGRIPPLSHAGNEQAVKVTGKHVDETTGATVSIAGRMNPKSGRDKLVLDMRRLPKDTVGGKKKRRNKDRVRLFFEDGDGQLVEVRDVPLRRRGRARMKFRTKKGDALPGGASSLRELSGRAFEIRVGNTLAVRGFVPFF